jgi:hypothetical protein
MNYFPIEVTIDTAFKKAVVTSKKKMLDTRKLSVIDLPMYLELTAKFALELIKTDTEVLKYVPDYWYQPKVKFDNNNFYNLLSTK